MVQKTRHPADAGSVARTLLHSCKSEWLTTQPSQTGFGGERGIRYSVTADADDAAGAAYQANATLVVVRIFSPCAAASVEDRDE